MHPYLRVFCAILADDTLLLLVFTLALAITLSWAIIDRIAAEIEAWWRLRKRDRLRWD